MREGVTTSIRIVTETLHKPAATTPEEKETEKNGRTGMKRVGIKDQDPSNMVGWKMVLQKVQLEDSGGNEKHPSLLIDHLALLNGP